MQKKNFWTLLALNQYQYRHDGNAQNRIFWILFLNQIGQDIQWQVREGHRDVTKFNCQARFSP